MKNQQIQKQIIKVGDFKSVKPKQGSDKPTGDAQGAIELIVDFLKSAKDQTTLINFCEQQSASQMELSLMVINFRKTKDSEKSGKTAPEWKKVVKAKEEVYTKAMEKTKDAPEFNERAFVREMCNKYGEYIVSNLITEENLKLHASKCAIYVHGPSWLMAKIRVQINEMVAYQNSKIQIVEFKYRRPISVIELTRNLNEKTEESDYEGILAWLLHAMKPLFTVKLPEVVDFMKEIKAIQIKWHQLWEPVITNKDKKLGRKGDVLERVKEFQKGAMVKQKSSVMEKIDQEETKDDY